MSADFRLVWLLGGLALLGCPADDGASDGMDAGAMTSAAESASDTTGSDGSTGAVAVDYATDIQPIWNGCNCHLQGPSGNMLAMVLTLNEGQSFDELVGTMSEQAAMARVTPGDLEQSYLWHKLQGTHVEVGGSGTQMPQVGMLSDAQATAIEAWILGGAQP